MVNETFVKRFLDGRNPLGLQFSAGGGPAPDITIVGVVKDSHYSSVKDPAPPLYYRPWRQDKEINWTLFLRAHGAAREADGARRSGA